MLTTLVIIQCLTVAAPKPVTFAAPGQAYLTGGGKFEMERKNQNISAGKQTNNVGYGIVEVGGGAFITNCLALGGGMSLDTYFREFAHLQKFSIGPVLSYVLALTQNIYWWPKLSVGFSAVTFGSARKRGGHVELDPAFLLGATSNFGVNIGPYARYTRLDEGSDTELTYGLRVGFTLWNNPPKLRD